VSDSRTLLHEAARRLAAAGVDSPRLDARLLWEHAACDPARFDAVLSRRLAREPLAYITGHKEFWSLDLEVGPGILIPRPETETIIEQALALLPDHSASLRVLDIGTGSGCLLAAFLKEFPNASGLGIDISPEALATSARNLARSGLSDRAQIRASDMGEGLDGPFDVILSNPPYIRTSDLAALAPELRYEPVGALDGGPDGLASIRLLAQAMARLKAGLGLVEIGAGQAADASAIFLNCGLQPLQTAPDLAGIPRVLVTRGGARNKC
jgi:release factor glutamine methyltransferase